MKKYKNPSEIFTSMSGKSVEELLDIDLENFNMLDEKYLRKAVTRLVSAGNKRLKRLAQSDVYSPAWYSVMYWGKGKFSVKGKNLNQLRAEFIRIRKFFEMETSTVIKAKKVRDTVISSMEKEGVRITKEQYNRVFRAYEELKQRHPEISNVAFKYRALTEITRLDSPNVDKIVSDMETKLNDIYEEEMEELALDEFSNMFNLGSNL
jgi:hypothetical protein